jgi:hypothetical protein
LAAGCLIGQALWPNVQPELIEARIMPQDCQFVGVNSVTNIELNKGVLPAPIIRNADWFETLLGLYCWRAFLFAKRFLIAT